MQPTPYTPTTDFSQQEANNASGRSTVNTAALDAEFANVEQTLDETLANLSLVQRDDGKLADLTVQMHTISPEVLNLMGGFRLTGLWQAATAYAANDIATNGDYTYVCHTAHTSGGAFDGQYWTQFGFSGGGDAQQAAIDAQNSANAAATSATSASGSATSASASATTATTQASNAANSATTATTQASNAGTSATNAANSAAAAATSAANLPNATTAGANKFLKTDSGGTAWEYQTAAQARASLGATTVGGAVFTAADEAAARTALAVLSSAQNQTQSATRFSAGGTADAITGTLAPAIASYTAGLRVTTTPAGANTVTGPTLKLNSLGTKTIKKRDSGGAKVALVAGEYNASGPFDFEYDGTDFILLNPSTWPTNVRGSDIASASTINLTTATGDIVDVTGTTSITAITLADGLERQVRFAGALTLTNGASLILPGGANITTAAGDVAVFRGYAAGVVRCVAYTKANGQAVVGAGGITLGTPVATTSGTSIDFTGIPAGTKRIAINFSGVSTSGTSNPIIQIGDSGGIENTGYLGTGVHISGGTGETAYTAGFGIRSAVTTQVLHGSLILSLLDAAANTWSAIGIFAGSGTVAMFLVAGAKSTSATLDRVRITTLGGTDTFDAGSINITYE